MGEKTLILLNFLYGDMNNPGELLNQRHLKWIPDMKTEKTIDEIYTVYITHSKEFAGNQGKHQNWAPSILPHNLWLIFMGIKQKTIFLQKKKNPKWPIFQNGRFSKSPILKNFLWKFHGLVLGLVGLIDAKGIDVAQPIWLWGCLT